MNLHEFQSKDLFRKYGIPVPKGAIATTPNEAKSVAHELGGEKWVVKAQIHSGGRGKAGGVKIAKNQDEVTKFAKEMLGKTFVTKQTGSSGLPSNSVYIESATDYEKELYISLLVDREDECISVISSKSGGGNIEEVAEEDPNSVFKIPINAALGIMPYQLRKLSIGLGLTKEQSGQLTSIIKNTYNLFLENDASLVEINPLVVSKKSELIALDAKINIDSNALFRQPELLKLKDPTQEDESENDAAKKGLNYVSLNGNIACLVNGAGLAMATMDLIKLHGGEPANFLDVGGGATSEKVSYALKLILANENVQGILVNIFGGIVRCDLIAQGIIDAVKEIEVSLPVVVRLEGTNVEDGKEILKKSGLEIITATDLTDAAKKVVEAVNK